jgi:hypothetical protein
MHHRAFLVALALGVSACAHGQSTTTTQPDSTSAQNDTATPQPETTPAAPAADQSAASAGSIAATASPNAFDSPESTSPPESSATAATTGDTSTGTQCDILPNAQVEDVVRLTVKDVHVSSSPDRCEFTFKEKPYAGLSIEYAPGGGKEDLDSTRRAEGGVQGMVGGLFKAAGGDNNSDAQSMQSVVIATPPPDLPKVGDDQFAYSVGILTSYLATKGDAYVEVGIGGFTPDGMSRWQATGELASRVLASH